MKDTISNLNYKIVEAGEDAAFTLAQPNALTENQIRHATLMLARAYDNGTLLLFEVTNNVIKQFIRFNICPNHYYTPM